MNFFQRIHTIYWSVGFRAFKPVKLRHGLNLGDNIEAKKAQAARLFLQAWLAESHDDTTLEDVLESDRLGITVAEFPTTLEAAEACRAKAQFIVMGAPNIVRGGSHSGNVAAQELARGGLLVILSSDYVPAALLNAAVSLGTLLEDMTAGIRTVTACPADAVGFDDRGRVAPEKRADLVRFAMHDGLPIIKSVWSRGQRIA